MNQHELYKQLLIRINEYHEDNVGYEYFEGFYPDLDHKHGSVRVSQCNGMKFWTGGYHHLYISKEEYLAHYLLNNILVLGWDEQTKFINATPRHYGEVI